MAYSSGNVNCVSWIAEAPVALYLPSSSFAFSELRRGGRHFGDRPGSMT